MPRFFFHTDNIRDVDGTELKSVAVAKCEAIKLAGRIICDEASEFWDRAEWTLTVSDDRGLTLFELCIVGTDSAAIPSARRTSPSTPA